MKVSIVTDRKALPQELIIPVEQHDKTGHFLTSLATQFELPNGFITDFKGKYKETLVLYSNQKNPSKIYLVGLGKKPSFIKTREALRSFAFQKKDKFDQSIGLETTYLSTPLALEAAINGLELSTYNIHLFHSKTVKPHFLTTNNLEILLNEENNSLKKEAIQKGIATGETQKQAFDLVNLDAAHLKPTALANWAVQSGKKYGYEVKVFDKTASAQLGLKAFLAVNRASEFAPAFIVAEYRPKNLSTAPKVGFVGKGVTFDTGGLNIKTAGMHFMKSDMGGAAAVLGAIELTAKLQLPIHLTVIVPATDNCVDALAIRPSDVIDSFSGKTIEIIDTDAEGRLTLADGVAYMIKNYQPDVLIDVATLTGSSIRALGYHAGALFSSSSELANELKAVGERTGERLWELPLYEEFINELKSDVADIRNLGTRPMAGASTAAKFVQFFTDNHPKWAHLDIAGVAFSDSEYTKQKAGTAFGVNLLVEYLKGLIKNSSQEESA